MDAVSQRRHIVVTGAYNGVDRLKATTLMPPRGRSTATVHRDVRDTRSGFRPLSLGLTGKSSTLPLP